MKDPKKKGGQKQKKHYKLFNFQQANQNMKQLSKVSLAVHRRRVAVAAQSNSIKEETPFHMDKNQNPQKSQTTSES